MFLSCNYVLSRGFAVSVPFSAAIFFLCLVRCLHFPLIHVRLRRFYSLVFLSSSPLITPNQSLLLSTTHSVASLMAYYQDIHSHNKSKHILDMRGHGVAQLVEALRYKLEGRGFGSRWCHWNFSLT